MIRRLGNVFVLDTPNTTYAFGVIPIIFAVVMVKVCIERIKEIKGGEEDDIGKY